VLPHAVVLGLPGAGACRLLLDNLEARLLWSGHLFEDSESGGTGSRTDGLNDVADDFFTGVGISFLF